MLTAQEMMYLEFCQLDGKSLCYACLPQVFDSMLQPVEPSIVIVVTPLTAIMEDQVRMLTNFMQ